MAKPLLCRTQVQLLLQRAPRLEGISIQLLPAVPSRATSCCVAFALRPVGGVFPRGLGGILLLSETEQMAQSLRELCSQRIQVQFLALVCRDTHKIQCNTIELRLKAQDPVPIL